VKVKDVSRFRAFGCKAWVHLNLERREKGKHTPRVLEALFLGFEPNTTHPREANTVVDQPSKV
jgi:hypothetical protein